MVFVDRCKLKRLPILLIESEQLPVSGNFPVPHLLEKIIIHTEEVVNGISYLLTRRCIDKVFWGVVSVKLRCRRARWRRLYWRRSNSFRAWLARWLCIAYGFNLCWVWLHIHRIDKVTAEIVNAPHRYRLWLDSGFRGRFNDWFGKINRRCCLYGFIRNRSIGVLNCLIGGSKLFVSYVRIGIILYGTPS